MSTTYDVDRLDQRQKLQSCTHVVTGVIDGIENVEVEELEKGKRVITVFGVDVVKVNFGDALPRRVLLRVVGGSSAGVSTPWTAPMEPRQEYVLVLAPDFGTRPDQFVPCFGSVFAVNPNGELELDSDTAAELRLLAGARADARIMPATLGAAARNAKTPDRVTGRNPDLHEVAVDRVTSTPSDFPVREIQRTPSAPRRPKSKKNRRR